jgi:hypothetical protein
VSDLVRAEAALLQGCRIEPGPDGASAELTPHQPSWGWGSVAFLTVWCVFWDLGLLASVGVGARMNWSGWSEDPIVRWLIFVPFFWIPGVAATALTLHQIFVRATWILRPGRVTRRYRALALSLRLDDDVTHVEIIHGTWKTGRGANVKVCLVVPSQRRLELIHQSDRSTPVPAEILALATAVAGHVAVPMRVVETIVPEPSSD